MGACASLSAARKVPGALIATFICLSAACVGGSTVRTVADSSGVTDVSQLWQEPADLESRDLRLGPAANAPAPEPPAFTFAIGRAHV